MRLRLSAKDPAFAAAFAAAAKKKPDSAATSNVQSACAPSAVPDVAACSSRTFAAGLGAMTLEQLPDVLLMEVCLHASNPIDLRNLFRTCRLLQNLQQDTKLQAAWLLRRKTPTQVLNQVMAAAVTAEKAANAACAAAAAAVAGGKLRPVAEAAAAATAAAVAAADAKAELAAAQAAVAAAHAALRVATIKASAATRAATVSAAEAADAAALAAAVSGATKNSQLLSDVLAASCVDMKALAVERVPAATIQSFDVSAAEHVAAPEPPPSLLMAALCTKVPQYDRRHSSALHVACHRGVSTVVAALIKAGASVNSARPSDGATPLHIACRKGHIQCVQHLLRSPELKPNKVDRQDHSALFAACEGRHVEVVKLLLQRQDVRVNGRIVKPLNGGQEFRDAAPLAAVMQNRWFGVGSHCPAQSAAESAIAAALTASPRVRVNVLMKFGNGRDVLTPLLQACMTSRWKIAALLLRHKHIEQLSDGSSLINMRGNKDGGGKGTALYHACRQGNVECVRLLLKLPTVDVNSKGDCGCTPLEAAYKWKQHAVVHMLTACKGLTQQACAGVRGLDDLQCGLVSDGDSADDSRSGSGGVYLSSSEEESEEEEEG